MPQRHTTHNAMEGFTLVEMAIVLVVIGLLVGAIFVGRDLIHAAELRSVVSDIEKFKSAVNTFKLKFNGIPGDMTDATTYWGVDPNGCPNTAANTVPKIATCDGVGNGRIVYGAPVTYWCETFRFWQQLANAGLIPGSYSGASSGGGGTIDCSAARALLGVSIPPSKISGAGYMVFSFTAIDFSNWGTPISTQYTNTNYFILTGVA